MIMEQQEKEYLVVEIVPLSQEQKRRQELLSRLFVRLVDRKDWLHLLQEKH